MVRAQHSIAILGWELSFTFGLALVADTPQALRPTLTHHTSKWITIEDVLLSRALAGVRVRIIVWRHSMVNYFNKYANRRQLYDESLIDWIDCMALDRLLGILADVNIQNEARAFKKRATTLGLTCKMFFTTQAMVLAHTWWCNTEWWIAIPECRL
jgi:hypothetical protein